MKIHYYFRNKLVGFSIQTVFTTLINQISKYHSTRVTYLVTPFANIISIIRNSIYALKCEKHGEINHITGDVHYLLYVLNKKRTIVYSIFSFSLMLLKLKYIYGIVFLE